MFWKGSSPKERAVPAAYLTAAARKSGLSLIGVKTVNSLLIFRWRRWLKRLNLDVPKTKYFWLLKTRLEEWWEPWSGSLPFLKGMNSFYVMKKNIP